MENKNKQVKPEKTRIVKNTDNITAIQKDNPRKSVEKMTKKIKTKTKNKTVKNTF